MLATSYARQESKGETDRTFLDAGANPPEGVVVSYYLKQPPDGEATLTFLDSKGQTIKSLSSVSPEQPPPTGELPEPMVPVAAGMNRFVWNMRYPDARRVEGDGAADKGVVGPLASPDTYYVRLAVGDHTQTQSFQLLTDPRVSATQEDMEAQHALLLRIRDKLSETHDAVGRIRTLKAHVNEWAARCEGVQAWIAVSNAATEINEKLSAIEDELILPKASPDIDRTSDRARLNAKVAELTSVVASADSAPTKQSYQVFDELSARVDAQVRRLGVVDDDDLPAFINLLRELEIPAIVPSAAL